MACQYCHQPESGEITIASPSLQSTEAEVAYIHSERRLIKDLSIGLQEKDAALRRRLNTIQSTTRSLPPETLSLIFQYACLPRDSSARNDIMESWEPQGSKAHLLLRSVSSYWRQVVDSTPQLWTTICLKVLGPGAIPYLQLHLQRSGSLPIDLSLKFHARLLYQTNTPPSSDIEEAISQDGHRIRSLVLDSPPAKWLSLIPSMVRLTACSISFSLGCCNERLVLANPHLTRLLLSGRIGSIHVEPSGSMITSLNLSEIPVNVCVSLLVGCPNLRVLRCSSLDLPMPGIEACTLRSPLALQHLEILAWELSGLSLSDFNNNFFGYIRVPALKTLSWVEDEGSVWCRNARAFSQCLPTTLTALEFVGIPNSSDHTSKLLNSIPSSLPIEHMTVEMCTIPFISCFLSGLMVDDVGGEKVVPFPNLKRVTIDGCQNQYGESYHKLDWECGDYLLEVLAGRKDFMQEFTLAMNYVDFANEPDVYCSLKQMVREKGLKLRFVSNGEEIDLLDESDEGY